MALRLELPQLIDFQMHRKPGNKIALQTGHVPFVAASSCLPKAASEDANITRNFFLRWS
jgi:hypothetical protein